MKSLSVPLLLALTLSITLTRIGGKRLQATPSSDPVKLDDAEGAMLAMHTDGCHKTGGQKGAGETNVDDSAEENCIEGTSSVNATVSSETTNDAPGAVSADDTSVLERMTVQHTSTVESTTTVEGVTFNPTKKVRV